jgi:hypothetical protein
MKFIRFTLAFLLFILANIAYGQQFPVYGEQTLIAPTSAIDPNVKINHHRGGSHLRHKSHGKKMQGEAKVFQRQIPKGSESNLHTKNSAKGRHKAVAKKSNETPGTRHRSAGKHKMMAKTNSEKAGKRQPRKKGKFGAQRLNL